MFNMFLGSLEIDDRDNMTSSFDSCMSSYGRLNYKRHDFHITTHRMLFVLNNNKNKFDG